MKLWIDADAAPRDVKEIAFRAAKRLELETVLVANQRLQVPPGNPFVTAVRVEGGPDVADRHIVESAEPGDVAVTADVPLAAALVEKRVAVIDPRGEEYTADNVGERLACAPPARGGGGGGWSGGHAPLGREGEAGVRGGAGPGAHAGAAGALSARASRSAGRMTRPLFTLGHSNHPFEVFADLLERHGITAVADVRSAPYSRFNPQFNREALRGRLRERGVAYAFLGGELGARSRDPGCYVDGRVRYDRLARTAAFAAGLARLRAGVERHRVALVCAEKDPITCHRMILVCRHLRGEGLDIGHVLPDGSLESHADAELRLVAALGIEQQDLFAGPDERVRRAYDLQAERIAYVAPAAGPDASEPPP